MIICYCNVDKEYLVIGGMPAANDFPKYNRRHSSLLRIEKIWKEIIFHLREKIKYSTLSAESSSKLVRETLELMFKAKIIIF
ncbi:MAG: hypothetical protein HQK53_01340 [Oligoflexia bacterium]|nr:hypothetical protein [Oligoflexia bacterium]